MTRIASSILLAVIAAIALSGAGPFLDAYDAQKAQRAVAAEAARKQTARGRFERAAHEICGIGAAWTEPAPGQIQRWTHRGRKTFTAQLGD